MQTDTSRRALLGGVGLASVALLAPAIASAVASTPAGSSPFRAALDGSDAARDRFNSLPVDLEIADEAQFARETDLMITAARRADAAMPTNWQEYTRLIGHMTDDGHSSIDDDNATRLLSHARRLSAREA
jgi:hypothetical protein